MTETQEQRPVTGGHSPISTDVLQGSPCQRVGYEFHAHLLAFRIQRATG
jgi:hypothetical protein